MRCRSCDTHLIGINARNKHTGREEELCSACLSLVRDIDFIVTKSYQWENAREGVTSVPLEYYDNL